MNPVVARVMSTVAGQLGNPSGFLGKGVARMLDRGNRFLIDAAVAASEVAPGESAADIGFGGGIGLTLLLDRVGAQGTVTGVELSRDMLKRAESRLAQDISSGRLRVLEGSLTDLPLADGSLDVVITANTLYFVPELDRACAELARVLRPKGRLVVGVGDPDAMAKMPFTQYGFTLRPVTELAAALEQAGLVVEQRRLEHRPIPVHLLIARPE
ncbi:methyltransferase domain-containing protein [Nocardia sp. NPDC051030]|uniref:class I SAM-dependent methyltransferase n=1 Tax=Nocardia sp. NPDC051030 TaxID=3155162 RepID=UPI00343A4864